MANEPDIDALPVKALEVKESDSKPLKGKGQIEANGCKSRPDSSRLNAAKELVAAGMPVNKAMRAAGYSPNTARQNHKYPVKRLLSTIRDKYLKDYVKQIKKAGLTGDRVAVRLGEIVHGKDDYNAVAAIKTHTMILLKNAQTVQEHSNFFGVFTIAAAPQGKTWENEAKEAEQIKVDSLIKEAIVVDNAA